MPWEGMGWCKCAMGGHGMVKEGMGVCVTPTDKQL